MQGLFLPLASPGATVTISEQIVLCFEKFMSQSKKNCHQSAMPYCFLPLLTDLTYSII